MANPGGMKSDTNCTVCHQDAPFEGGVFWTNPDQPTAWNWSHTGCHAASGTFDIAGPDIDTSDKAVEWRTKLLQEARWLKLGALDVGLQRLHPCLMGGCC